jgi:membrane protein
MAQHLTFWERRVATPKYYVGGVYRLMNEKPAFLWAQAIAFKVLVTIVPIVVLATGILSSPLLLGPSAFQNVAGYIRQFVPYQSEQLIGLLQQLQTASTTITVIGVLGLVFSIMTLFTTLRIVVSSIFQEEWHTQRTILRGYAFDLRMALQVGLLFVLTYGLSLAMTTFNAAGFQFFQRVGLDYVWLQEGWRQAFTAFGYVVPFLLTIGMFFQLLYFIPKPHPPKRSALLGAFVTALLWEAAKHLFNFYVTRSGRFARYGAQPGESEMDLLVRGFGLIIAFVFWIYYSGIVLCIGAMFGLLHEKKVRTWRKLRQMKQVQAAAADEREPRLALATQVTEHEREDAKESISVG